MNFFLIVILDLVPPSSCYVMEKGHHTSPNSGPLRSTYYYMYQYHVIMFSARPLFVMSSRGVGTSNFLTCCSTIVVRVAVIMPTMARIDGLYPSPQ